MKKTLRSAIATILCLCMLLFLFGCAGNKENGAQEKIADLVVFGNIYTAEEENDSMAEAFAVKDGKYVYVGNADGVKSYIREGVTEVIDKTGDGLIIPGATEGHAHFLGMGEVAKFFPGGNMEYDELKDMIKEMMSSDPKPTQISTIGWTPGSVDFQPADDKSYARELEELAPGIPVLLTDGSGHNAICNVTALKMAGLWDGKTEVRGGSMLYTRSGEPNGIIRDASVFYVATRATKSALTVEQYIEAVKNAVDTLHSRGYTNYADGYINSNCTDEGIFEAIKAVDDAGELTINMSTNYGVRSADDYKEKIDYVTELVEKYNSDHVNVANVKLFADGVTDVGTGWIIDEYANAPEGREHGNQEWTREELMDIVQYANSKGILIHTHSYGDAACNAMVDAYVASNEANGTTIRNCLVHARNITDDDLDRIAENGIAVAGAQFWHYYDPICETSGMPQELVKHGYQMKSVLDKGIHLSSSTDEPATGSVSLQGSILNIIEVATTGLVPETDGEPFDPAELISVKDELKILTINGAWQLGLENERGSIKVGKYADFVIIDKNIIKYTGEQLRTIHNAKITDTYFEGKKVF